MKMSKIKETFTGYLLENTLNSMKNVQVNILLNQCLLSYTTLT